ncbi:hypothetical protein BSKO_00791 [Bryopsis sp. KO-2023]|nr:hypothetical protein BSKO_00791 [Bryopsis sp. KO-2023]
MPFCGFRRFIVICGPVGEAGWRPHRQGFEGTRPRSTSVDSPRQSTSLAGQGVARCESPTPLLAAREMTPANLNNAMSLPWEAFEHATFVETLPTVTTKAGFDENSVFCAYDFCEKVGSGTYGTVYTAVEKSTGRRVAVKEIGSGQKTGRNKSSGCNMARQEARIMEALQDCSSVVGFKHCFQGDGKKKYSYIVMELCGGGDLEHFTEENGPIMEGQAGVVAFEALNMLRSCHQKRILHGDVKPANFMIHSEIQHQIFKHGPTRLLRPGWLKGIDFGTCQQLGYGGVTKRVGTPTHWSPEVFGGHYYTEADMWSLGVLVYELMAGRNPFFTKDEERAMRSSTEILRAVMQRKPDFSYGPWLECSPQGIDFIKGLLTLDPRVRMKACEGLQHPWVKMHQTWRKKERPFFQGKPVELDTFIPCFA